MVSKLALLFALLVVAVGALGLFTFIVTTPPPITATADIAQCRGQLCESVASEDIVDNPGTLTINQAFASKESLLDALRWVRDMREDGLLVTVGYLGDDGDFHALSEADLK